MESYDTLIIGAGQAGIPLARFIAKKGCRVAVVERRHLGGSCVNFGCTPTKAVLASARVAQLARRASEYGLRIPSVEVDFPAVLDRAKAMIAKSHVSLRDGLEKSGADIIQGHARFVGREGDRFKIQVGEQAVLADRVVIDVGTRTLVPKIDGLADVPFLHAGNWLDGKHVPKSLLIVGAGYIGLEMAQFYRRMGADVCVIGSALQIAENEDTDVAEALQKLLEDEGIRFRLGARLASVRHGESGELIATLDGGETLDATELFLATGRSPNTDDLGLETVGVNTDDKGFLKVDERLSTSVAGIYAVGDVRGEPMFTHASWDDHRVLENQLFGDGRRTTAGRIVPYAVFTDPELGRVGLTERQARKKFGDAVKVGLFRMRNNSKAVQVGEPEGLIKLVADGDGRLLGAAVLSVEGAELVAPYITLMNAGATLDAICRGIYIHPTLAEAVQSATSALDLGTTPTGG